MHRLTRALGVFASGCVVYFVMAACGTTVNIYETAEEVPEPAGKPKPITDDAMVSASSAGDLTSSSSGDPFPSSASSTSGSPVPNAMADEWHKPGTRLRLMFIEAEDGTKEFRSWYDTKSGDACRFQTYSDSSLRCVPITFANNVVRPADKVWISPTCSSGRAIIVGAGLPPPKHFAEGVNMYLVNVAAYTGTAYVGTPADCAARTTTDQVFQMAFMPPSDFVAGQVKLAPVQ